MASTQTVTVLCTEIVGSTELLPLPGSEDSNLVGQDHSAQ
jgi:hypothetical protein